MNTTTIITISFQSRSVFLILYKLNEQRDSEKGLKGLSFWFKSLSCHLKQDKKEPKAIPFLLLWELI